MAWLTNIVIGLDIKMTFELFFPIYIKSFFFELSGFITIFTHPINLKQHHV